MLGARQAQRSKRNYCSPAVTPWALVALLSIISLGALFQLQLVSKEAAKSRARLRTLEKSHESDSNLYRTKLAQTDIKVAGFLQERDKMLAAQKDFTDKIKTAEQREKNATAACANATAIAKAAQERLTAAETEIKEITVKAGSCREQYNSLNAECATVKQGLANLGLNSQTVEQKADSFSGSQSTGALDPHGGMEAALVLKENSQQPWKPIEEREKASSDEEEVRLAFEKGTKDGTITNVRRQMRASRPSRRSLHALL